MPVQNLRIVVTGTPKADKEFLAVLVDRNEAQRLAEKLSKETEQVSEELKRELQRFARGF